MKLLLQLPLLAIILVLFNVVIVFLIELIVFAPATDSICVILMLIALLEVVGGFTISTAERQMSFG